MSKGKHSSQHVEDTVAEHDFLGCMSRLEGPDSVIFRYYEQFNDLSCEEFLKCLDLSLFR